MKKSEWINVDSIAGWSMADGRLTEPQPGQENLRFGLIQIRAHPNGNLHAELVSRNYGLELGALKFLIQDLQTMLDKLEGPFTE